MEKKICPVVPDTDATGIFSGDAEEHTHTHTHTHTQKHIPLLARRGGKKNSISSSEAQLKPSALPGLHCLSRVILLLQLRAWCSKPDFP